MYSFSISIVAVLVASIMSVILGMIWYSPLVFGKVWMKLVRSKDESKDSHKNHRKDRAMSYIASFILNIITAYFLALFIQNLFVPTLYTALQIGLFAGLGFTATTLANDSLYNPSKRSWRLFFITAGYYILSLLLQAFLIFILS